jgi:hypothetical protein
MGGQIIISYPVNEAAQTRPYWWTFNMLKHSAQFAGVNQFVAKDIIVPDNARQFAWAKRDHHDSARTSVHIGR